MLNTGDLSAIIGAAPRLKASGRVTAIRGPLILARMPHASFGQMCRIAAGAGRYVSAQIVAFQGDIITLAPFDHLTGISPGAEIESCQDGLILEIPEDPAGLVIDACGRPLAAAPRFGGARRLRLPVDRPPPNPLERRPIAEPMPTGIRCIDGLCPIGRGQRLGLFAAAGVGKSALLGMIARGTGAEVNVIALVAERGREVNDFIQEALGPEGLKKSVVVVATRDESPARREQAALSATAIAEHLRGRGKHVLLLVDSLTRAARAIREVGLAAGELPVRQGYTSSVYTRLPRLLERAGTDSRGSITAIYSVLTAGENDLDPLGEEIKSLLDGHIVLDSSVAAQGVRPAIDLTQSVSRLLPRVTSADEQRQISAVLKLIHRLKKDKEIVLLGGTPDPELQAALALESEITAFLNQRPEERTEWQVVRLAVGHLAARANTLK